MNRSVSRTVVAVAGTAAAAAALVLAGLAAPVSAVSHQADRPAVTVPPAGGGWVNDYYVTGAQMAAKWGSNNLSCGSCCDTYTSDESVTVDTTDPTYADLYTDGTPGACAQMFSPDQFTYGKFSAEVYFPGNLGSGVDGAYDWPAFWLVNETDWPEYGEIDAAEVNGWKASIGGQVTMSYHWGAPPYGSAGDHIITSVDPTISDAVGWHTFTVVWEPGYVDYYVDGTEVYSYTYSQGPLPAGPLNVVFQTTVSCGHPVDCATAPPGEAETMQVAWFSHATWQVPAS